MRGKELLHGIVVLFNQLSLRAVSQLHGIVVHFNQLSLQAVSQLPAADGLHLRLELLRGDKLDVLGGHRVLLPLRS